jgi:hypothetical protein
MYVRFAWCLLVGTAFATSLALGAQLELRAQNRSEKLSTAEARKRNVESRSPFKAYEDTESRILIPSGWRVSQTDRPAALLNTENPGVAQFPTRGHGLLLAKNGYTLAMNNDAGQTSPIAGGRFFEVFRIPWLEDVANAWACGGRLVEDQGQSVGRFYFFNLTFDSLSDEDRKTCGIPEGLEIKQRWFAGYFTTAKGAWLFGSTGMSCRQKAYTLTSGAKSPSELPDSKDPTLQKIIKEATEIVSSIHYKRCPPEKGAAHSRDFER